MFSEIGKSDNNEMRNPETQGFREIKPESGMSVSEANKYWDSLFSGKEPEVGSTGYEDNENPKQYFDDNGNKYREGDKLDPNTKFERNGYTFETDDKGRIKSVEGKLQVKDHEKRNPIKETKETIGRGESLDSDERGHLIADRFNGSGGLENLVPMDSKLNRGDYASLERTLADAVNDGADVRVKVEPVYENGNYRPSEIRYSYTINGEKDSKIFKNKRDD